MSAYRTAAGAHIFPEFEYPYPFGGITFGDFVVKGSYLADEFDTRHHFWDGGRRSARRT